MPWGVVILDVPGGKRTVARCEDPALVAEMQSVEFMGRPVQVENAVFSLPSA